MNCLPCLCCSFQLKSSRSRENKNSSNPLGNHREPSVKNGNIRAQTFTFRELATATRNFRQECLIGEGGFGRVYRGQLQGGQVVAVKQLDRNGLQGNKEFLVEVLMLSLLYHQNLVNLVGYCADGEQRILVYEYMPRGSLEDHLLVIEPPRKPLDWFIRMRIASGAAQGLEYLHMKANPPVIYRDLKASNILLDDKFNPKLSDFGLAKLGPLGDKVHVSSRVMGTYGYCAPEYARTGHLTLQSDVYSFGVVLLELITGRRVIDTTRPTDEQNLVSWAQPIFRDPRRFHEMADPLLNNNFPEKGLNQAVAIAAMCLQDEPSARPLMTDVVIALSFLGMAPKDEPTGNPSNENEDSGVNGSQHGVGEPGHEPAEGDEDRASDDKSISSLDDEGNVHDECHRISMNYSSHQSEDDSNSQGSSKSRGNHEDGDIIEDGDGDDDDEEEEDTHISNASNGSERNSSCAQDCDHHHQDEGLVLSCSEEGYGSDDVDKLSIQQEGSGDDHLKDSSKVDNNDNERDEYRYKDIALPHHNFSSASEDSIDSVYEKEDSHNSPKKVDGETQMDIK